MRLGNRNHPLAQDIVIGEAAQVVEEEGLFRLRYHATDDLIDRLAMGVAQLPQTLTVAQAQRVAVIAKELQRRGRRGRR